MFLGVIHNVFQLLAVILESSLSFFGEPANGQGYLAAISFLYLDITSSLEFR